MATSPPSPRSDLSTRLSCLAERAEGAIEIDAQHEAQEFVRVALLEIESEIALLAVDAQQTATAFWTVAKEGRNSVSKDQRSYLGTRVRLISGSLSIEWYRNGVSLGPDGKVKNLISKRIRKGMSFAYPKGSFDSEPQWIREVVIEAEKRYACIRERAAILSQMKRSLKRYAKLIDQ